MFHVDIFTLYYITLLSNSFSFALPIFNSCTNNIMVILLYIVWPAGLFVFYSSFAFLFCSWFFILFLLIHFQFAFIFLGFLFCCYLLLIFCFCFVLTFSLCSMFVYTTKSKSIHIFYFILYHHNIQVYSILLCTLLRVLDTSMLICVIASLYYWLVIVSKFTKS